MAKTHDNETWLKDDVSCPALDSKWVVCGMLAEIQSQSLLSPISPTLPQALNPKTPQPPPPTENRISYETLLNPSFNLWHPKP